jgi:hypothetical protein
MKRPAGDLACTVKVWKLSEQITSTTWIARRMARATPQRRGLRERRMAARICAAVNGTPDCCEPEGEAQGRPFALRVGVTARYQAAELRFAS